MLQVLGVHAYCDSLPAAALCVPLSPSSRLVGWIPTSSRCSYSMDNGTGAYSANGGFPYGHRSKVGCMIHIHVHEYTCYYKNE